MTDKDLIKLSRENLRNSKQGSLCECYDEAFIKGYKTCVQGWHKVSDGDLPRQDGNTCFSIKVLASNKKWVYYGFGSGKWFCGNKEVKVVAWKEIVFPSKKELAKE